MESFELQLLKVLQVLRKRELKLGWLSLGADVETIHTRHLRVNEANVHLFEHAFLAQTGVE